MSTDLKTIDGANFLAARSTDLQVMWENTNQAIVKMAPLNEVWCRSRSNWMLTNITVYAQGPDIWKRMRQISAEVEGRRAAMTEAKWELLRLQGEVDAVKEKLAVAQRETKYALEIEIGEKEDRIEAITRKFKGAMRDVLDLEVIYDKLSSEVGEITEENVEAAEHKAHLSRAIVQAVRSVRLSGKIDVGNQEYLEQCGVNPSMVLVHIAEYVEIEKNSERYDVGQLNAFIAEFTDHLLSAIQAKSVVAKEA